VSINLTVNGRVCPITVEPRMTLFDALREELALTGTKKACDRGECGACTVHVDGRRVLSCMTLAAMLQGKRATTIEGLEQGGNLHASSIMATADMIRPDVQRPHWKPSCSMNAVWRGRKQVGEALPRRTCGNRSLWETFRRRRFVSGCVARSFISPISPVPPAMNARCRSWA
jgi:2Fe-2S iron-sulfur cluster binding domain